MPFPFFKPSPEVNRDIIYNAYLDKTDEPNYENYSALQCAAYDSNVQAYRILLDAFIGNNTFVDVCRWVNKDNTKENIFHVAIKNPEILTLTFEAILDKERHLLNELLPQRDVDGDTILHQVVEFGRLESLVVLIDYARRDPLIHQQLMIALETKNDRGETPLDLAHDFKNSPTMARLILDEIIDDLDTSRQNLPAITEQLNALACMSQHRVSLK
ncbi:MAG: ankyrin repeat domain-containing protein [Gammaproteobacteria bacterium]|nr:ankyrin repeat domain-containing protein [Gammaproteobacteria bacterium]